MKQSKKCLQCGQVFFKQPYNSKKAWKKQRYCSTSCAGKAWIGHSAPKSAFIKGHKPWNKGTQGLKPYMNISGIIGKEGNAHPSWKGEQAKYAAIHSWVSRNKKKPDRCSDCGKPGNSHQIHWANIDHKYKRNLDDYVARCASCHKKYDLENGLCNH